MTPKTCFWSVDVPGRDPVVLLWAWWVSLALSRSLNLRHSPCGFLYNHLYCLPTTPLRVCVLRWLVAEVTSTAPSPSATSRRRFPSMSPANLLSFRCCARYPSILKLQTVTFHLVFRKFRKCSENSLVCSHVFSKSSVISLVQIMFHCILSHESRAIVL